MENNGYLIVASKKPAFYSMAINLAESIKDYYPEAKICLVTEERFLDVRAKNVADHIILCDDHYRAKIWGMAQTPFDKTFYIDADCEVVHEDIATVFDQLGDDDMKFTYLGDDRKYIFVELYFGPNENRNRMELCGACCLYDWRKPIVKEFITDWYDLFCRQWNNSWWPLNDNGGWDEINYPRSLKVWDQFTLWWLTKKDDKYKDVKIGVFEDDARWNWYMGYDREKTKIQNPEIIQHYSFWAPKDAIL